MLKQFCRLLVLLVLTAWAGAAAAVPITDIVTADGKEWAQVELFKKLSWLDVSSQCPVLNDVCNSGSSLNGFDLTGWTWATTTDINLLFNVYLVAAGYSGDDLLGGGPDALSVNLPGMDFTLGVFADFRLTLSNNSISQVGGWLRGDINESTARQGRIVKLTGSVHAIRASTTEQYDLVNPSPASGAWFLRRTAVPTPATLPLLCLGLATIGYSCRKRKLLG
ncbi:MAG: hypothetical protein IPG64_23275 [Haliea sp.]|nr:hypothetical protein [Haliea sp.]MBK6740545.1 hypothetical protein [Haliea sp.]